MKKSTKIILLIAACLLSAGVIFTAAGLLSGASFSQIMDSDLWNMSWNPHSGGDDSGRSAGAGNSSDFDESNTYKIDTDGINSLSIDWVDGDIQVIAYDGDQILLKESCREEIDDDNCLRYRIKNGSLDIACCQEKSGVSFSFFNKKTERKFDKPLVVKVPKALASKLKELEIDAVSSDITVNGLTLKEFLADTVSGSVTLLQCSVSELETSTVSGDIDMSLLQCPKDLAFDTTSGDIKLQLPHDSSFRLSFDTVSGDASVKGFDADCLNKDDGYAEYQVGNGRCEINADTVSGDITITKSDHH